MSMEPETQPGRIPLIVSRRLVGRLVGCENDHLLLERVSRVMQKRKRVTYDACELRVEGALLLSPRCRDEQTVGEVVHRFGLEVVG